ncbi:MAG: cupin domain-containing protein, partial [Catenulispora sp.]
DDFTVSFETFPQDADGTEAFRGLPDDRCQCPHWGLVRAGRLELRYRDRTEAYEAGDVYYAPPGHVPVAAAGTETVEFSPTAEFQKTMTVVAANMTAAEGGAR